MRSSRSATAIGKPFCDPSDSGTEASAPIGVLYAVSWGLVMYQTAAPAAATIRPAAIAPRRLLMPADESACGAGAMPRAARGGMVPGGTPAPKALRRPARSQAAAIRMNAIR